MAKLILCFKGAVLKEYLLDKPIYTIGRAANNDIVIDNLIVSSYHARVVSEGGLYFIEDLHSTNGTYIGEHRITRAPLSDRTQITIGKHTVVFNAPESVDADATTAIRKSADFETTMVMETNHPHIEGTQNTQTLEVLGGFVVLEGSTEQTEYELTRCLTTIGKAESAEIKLKGFFAPKVAALINRLRDKYVIGPASGEKPPRVNGKPIDGPTTLKNLDIVEVGNLKLQFYLKE